MVKFWFAMISTFARKAQAIEFSGSESNPSLSFSPLPVPLRDDRRSALLPFQRPHLGSQAAL
jgi:hypothetical protein